MRARLRQSSLSLVFLALFLLALAGQAVAGWKQLNAEQVAQHLDRIGFAQYLASANFVGDVAENWQSEYLQFLLYVVLTVWLLQRGSPESKELDRAGRETDRDQKLGAYARPDSPRWARAGGWRTAVYSSSLGLAMGVLFLASWATQSVAGWRAYDQSQLQDLRDPITWPEYLVNPDFWSRSLQNWQSEFLAVASMALLSIRLRQRGSPESKPVGEPHSSTGTEG